MFVVQWNNVLIRGTTNRVSFEVQLFDGGEIDVVYRDIGIDAVEHGASATVGIQDDSTGVALQESFLGSTDVANDSTIQFRADRAPVAKAGPDAIVPLNTDFSLDGGASSDPDDNGAALLFQWSVAGKVVNPTKAGSKIVIDNAQQALATVHGIDRKRKVTFQLVVTDPFGRQAFDFVIVKVQP